MTDHGEIADVELDGCVLDACDLEGLTWRRVVLRECRFIGCNFSRVRFVDTRLVGCVIEGGKALGVGWSGARLSRWPAVPLHLVDVRVDFGSFTGMPLRGPG